MLHAVPVEATLVCFLPLGRGGGVLVLVLGGSQTLVLLLCESVCNIIISTLEGCACKDTCMLSSFLLVDHICVDVRDGCDAEGWEEEEECGPQRFLR